MMSNRLCNLTNLTFLSIGEDFFENSSSFLCFLYSHAIGSRRVALAVRQGAKKDHLHLSVSWSYCIRLLHTVPKKLASDWYNLLQLISMIRPSV